jgi:anti-sigma B factor antagonist
MSDPGFKIRVTRPHEGAVVIEVIGEVDLCSSISLREQVNRVITAGSLLVIDVEQVTLLDSSGLGCLVGVAHRAAKSGSAVVLSAPGRRVRRVMETTGVDRLIPMYETREQALLNGRGRAAAAAAESES